MRDWLVAIREEKNLSQQAVADKSGISQSYYAAIETEARGNKLPQPTAAKIAAALGFNWTRFYETNKAEGIHNAESGFDRPGAQA